MTVHLSSESGLAGLPVSHLKLIGPLWIPMSYYEWILVFQIVKTANDNLQMIIAMRPESCEDSEIAILGGDVCNKYVFRGVLVKFVISFRVFSPFHPTVQNTSSDTLFASAVLKNAIERSFDSK